MPLTLTLDTYVQDLIATENQISTSRKESLLKLAAYLQKKQQTASPTKVTIICTHNSRRSHLGQCWLHVAAHHYGIKNIEVYSGGTEATQFNPNAVAALQRTGVEISKLEEGDNPKYLMQFGDDIPKLTAFSKAYFDEANPQREFAAVMVCTDADEGCPVVIGAEARFSLPYDDPKTFDGTAQEREKYDERCQEIGREMFFVMKAVSDSV